MTKYQEHSQASENAPLSRNRLAEPRGLPDMLLYRLNRLRAVGGAMVLRFCEGRFGITRREWVVLALLINEEGVTPTELASKAELTKSATSKALGSLQQKGLINKVPQRGDHRFAQLSLSDAGKELYSQILPLVEEVNRDLMSCLSLKQTADLDAMIALMEIQASSMAERIGALPKANRRLGGTQRRTGAETHPPKAFFT